MAAPILSCGCPNLTNQTVCGDFATPVNPDTGGCCPPAMKTSCEAPSFNNAPCPGEVPVALTTYAPFKILTQLFDSTCSPITDEAGNVITTIYVDGTV